MPGRRSPVPIYPSCAASVVCGLTRRTLHFERLPETFVWPMDKNFTTTSCPRFSRRLSSHFHILPDLLLIFRPAHDDVCVDIAALPAVSFLSLLVETK